MATGAPVAFPVTSTGFTGQYVPPSADDRVYTPRELYEHGFQVLEWDGRFVPLPYASLHVMLIPCGQ